MKPSLQPQHQLTGIRHAFLFSLFGLLVFSAKMQAATYPVNSYSTLTSSLTAAADGDTISLTDNIVVTAEVALTKSLVFRGNNYTISVPVPGLNDAGVYNGSPSAFRVFTISTAGKTVVFNRLVIKGGSTSSPGAAIVIGSGVTVKFNNSVIANSRGPAGSGGGGLYNLGTCYLYATQITRNASGFAGGFYNAGLMFMEYSTVTDNRSLCAGCGGGGGVNYGNGAILYVNNSSFSNNQSSELGGAFENYGTTTGAAYFVNTSFTGNVGFNSGTTLKGGAIAQHAAGATYLINCLFAYNYWNNSGSAAPSSYVLNDIHAYSGTVNMYYTTYMATSVNTGTITPVIGNTTHALAQDGSADDMFTGGDYSQILAPDGSLNGSAKVFKPFLVTIGSQRVPTLKSASYALQKGCNTGFTNGNGTPVVGYKNMSTSAWVNLVGSGASAFQVNDDETQGARPALPAAGALERVVDNYAMLKVNAATNGTVYGASIYGDVYPAGTTVSFTAIPNAGYALSNWTYVTGGSGSATGNPLTLTLNQNTTMAPVFTSSSNYTITYLGNNNTAGSSPAVASYASGTPGTISGNTGNLAKSGFILSGWNTQSNGSGTDYTAGASYNANTNLTLYAKWVSTGLTLPISLTSFSATPGDQQQTVQIKWQCASETNNRYFEVQRSIGCTGKWETVAQVPSRGNSVNSTTYQVTDPQPGSDLCCYRLLQVDIDGRHTATSGVSVRLQPGAQKSFTLYPNPASGKVTIRYEGNLQDRLAIVNTLGQPVTQQCSVTAVSSREWSLDVSRLRSGIYYIKVDDMVKTLTVHRTAP